MAEDLGLYERLFMRAYDLQWGEDGTKLIVQDADIEHAYKLLITMRNTLRLCAEQFTRYGDDEKAQLDSSHLSLVETMRLTENMNRNHGIAGLLKQLLETSPKPTSVGWKDIATAPQNGRRIRLLGRTENGAVY